MRATLGAALLLAATACGQAPVTTTAAAATFSADRPDPRPAKVVLAVAPKPVAPAPKPLVRSMFRTPQGAMRYLARAYNRHDDVSLRHVTTDGVRRELDEMRTFATDLRLASCDHNLDGTYACTFSHAYVKGKGRGQAMLVVAPARKPGWYATFFDGCG
jgi:hypothetical protein